MSFHKTASLIIKDVCYLGLRNNLNAFRLPLVNVNFCSFGALNGSPNNNFSTSNTGLKCKSFIPIPIPCQRKSLLGNVTSSAIDTVLSNQIRHFIIHHIDRPSPETYRKNLRFKVHYPKDGVYTIKKLPMTKLAGRDPVTGRIIYGCIGGGHKRKYRWIDIHRFPLGRKEPLVERVLHIQRDPNRSAFIALVGHDDKLRYIIATTNMKKGDLITSSGELPRIPIRPKEGDAHPVGALPTGTVVCCIEKRPGTGAALMKSAGTSATITRKLKDKMVLMLRSKKEVALDQECIVTVGRCSNPDYDKIPIGSPNRLRYLGFRPRSGLWQRKDGRYGRKVRRPPPVHHFVEKKPKTKVLSLNIKSEQNYAPVVPATLRVS